jgi:hypothetical protein
MVSILDPDQSTATRTKPNKYPYLGKFPNGDVVLFIHRRRGICVHGVESNLGEYSYRWNESAAVPCNTPIKLKNSLSEFADSLPRFTTDSVYC